LERSQSDRYQPGTPSVLLRNATIWTGQTTGLEYVAGDLLLQHGIIKAVGELDASLIAAASEGELVEVDLKVRSMDIKFSISSEHHFRVLG
jgi:hypothetical protein